MNNKTLAVAIAFSILSLPTVSNARLSNEIISHSGIIAIPGGAALKLEQQAGRGITLNKGYMEIKTTKVNMGFSLLDPQLIIKQNGQTMMLDIASQNYAGDENFTLKASDSDLNYDLFLRKTTKTSLPSQVIKGQVCAYREYGVTCGTDFDGKYDCVAGMVDRSGVQQVRTSTVDVTDTYKLTLGQKNVLKAEFTSSKTRSEILSTEELSRCK